MCPKDLLDVLEKKKFSAYKGIQTPDRAARSLVATRTLLLWLAWNAVM